MTEAGSTMSPGWSLHRYEGQWREEQLSTVSVTETLAEIELEREDDVVSLTLRSDDGLSYRGDYRYREGSNSNGEARFVRYTNTAGTVFVGQWKESDAASGPWILVLGRVNSQK